MPGGYLQLFSLNDRVVGMRENEYEINLFVEEYKPFIASCTEKVIGRYVRYGEDDELSISMMGFVEAIKSFDNDKGNFLPFAQNVIKRRLIDYYRKEKKNISNVISLNEYRETDDDNEEYDLSAAEAVQLYSVREESEYRRLELEQLKTELADWDISFFELAEASPKHAKTKKICSEVTGYLLSRPELIKTIKEKKYVPVAEISKSLRVPRKFVDRFRKYVISVIIISTGDYQYIRDYVSFNVD